MEFAYNICDVFTRQRFGGNPLAVLTDAQGLNTQQMQQIAREFNFSETTFVLPPEQSQTRKVRIFTPTTEVPFAGHPNIGTAFVLASQGEILEQMVFEEAAGLVPITLTPTDVGLKCELKAPQPVSLGQTLAVADVARALSLGTDDINTQTHPPQLASVGLPFIVVELNDLTSLQRAKVNSEGFEALSQMGFTPDIHLYVHSQDEFDLHTRMFAPLDGVPEDPATGSANCALAGLLAHYSSKSTAEFNWQIAQGVEMGRPSQLFARALKQDGAVTATWIAGHCIMVAEGFITVD